MTRAFVLAPLLVACSADDPAEPTTATLADLTSLSVSTVELPVGPAAPGETRFTLMAHLYAGCRALHGPIQLRANGVAVALRFEGPDGFGSCPETTAFGEVVPVPDLGLDLDVVVTDGATTIHARYPDQFSPHTLTLIEPLSLAYNDNVRARWSPADLVGATTTFAQIRLDRLAEPFAEAGVRQQDMLIVGDEIRFIMPMVSWTGATQLSADHILYDVVATECTGTSTCTGHRYSAAMATVDVN